MNNNSIALVNAALLSALENKTVPWHMSWLLKKENHNPITHTDYSYMNQALLSAAAKARGYQSRQWLTFIQIKNAGYTLKKGALHSKIFFWNFINKKSERINEDGESVPIVSTFPILKQYQVFNGDDIEGLPLEETGTPPVSDITLDTVINNYIANEGITLEYGNPAYAPLPYNKVYMPNKEDFESMAHYYSAFLHELGHSTGDTNRLNRKTISTKRGGKINLKAREELTAEIFALTILAQFGFDYTQTINDTAAYCKDWSKYIEEDNNLFITAFGMVDKAVEYFNLHSMETPTIKTA